MSVRISVESVSGCWWNGCPDGHGIPTKGDTLRATAYQAALTQTNKSCSNSTYNTQAQVDTSSQRQQNVNKAADAINAIGGLFK